MANNFTYGYADLFQKALDQQAVQEATTGWMDANAGQVIYNGGKTVKIPKMSLAGMGDYSRSSGYPAGGVTLTYETRELTQDRGTKILLDAMDVDETNFIASAGAVMSEFQRTQVVPEIDAYRLSALATTGITAGKVEFGYTVAKATIADKLIDAIGKVKEAGYRNVPLVIHATTAVVTALAQARVANASEGAFTANGLTTKVPTIDGIPIIETDSARMVTKITISDSNGWSKAVDGKDVNFIVMPRTAPIAISKQDNMKIFTPAENQTHDAWLCEYRRYHDLWVMDNKKNGIWVNVKDAGSASSSASAS